MLDTVYDESDPDVRRIDLMVPDAANGAAILFVHGGGWTGGSRAGWHRVMEHFCKLGYTCASPSYHLAPGHRFPKQIEDVRLAASYFKSRAGELGFDPRRIAVWGSSAGGHLAALLATLGPDDALGQSAAMPVRDTRPAAAVCLCSVFSLHAVAGNERLAGAFADLLGAEEAARPEAVAAASPIDRVTGAEPPFLMVVGDADITTPVALHHAMRDRLAGAGVRVDLTVLPGVAHGYGYGVSTPAQLETVRLAGAFLGEVLGVPARGRVP